MAVSVIVLENKQCLVLNITIKVFLDHGSVFALRVSWLSPEG